MPQTTYPSPSALATTTVGGSSVQVAQANPQRAGLYIFNPSAAATLWVTVLGNVAAVAGVGCVAIQPLQGIFFGAPNMPSWTNGMNAIYSTGSAAICVLEFYQ